MTTSSTASLQGLVANRLPEPDGLFAAIIGDRPSQSAKSPSIWNPVFQALGLPASYLALDVEPQRLGDVVRALRASDRYIGGNVTMPYKVAVVEHLDEVDEKAWAIGAVNTIVRTPNGRLVGYNTDGQGGLDCLTRPQPGQAAAVVPELRGRRVLVLGAGGAARALAFYLGEAIGRDGHLHISNRSEDRAVALAQAVTARSANCVAVTHAKPNDYDLVVNASTVGQSGIRRLPDGTVTCLEPFSPLAPCEAPRLRAEVSADEARFYSTWMREARALVDGNNAASLKALVDTPAAVVFFDIIFAPLETVLLRQARLTGHRTLNGKGMNVAQAADGFFNRVCRGALEARGEWTPETYQRVLETMYAVW